MVIDFDIKNSIKVLEDKAEKKTTPFSNRKHHLFLIAATRGGSVHI